MSTEDVKLVPPEPQPVARGIERIEQLDSLRGLAALNVFFAHCFLLYPQETPVLHWLGVAPTRLLLYGHPAVLFFFLLSGFVLYLPFTKPGKPRYGTYLVRRICRIYLPYMVGVTFAAVACQTFARPLPGISSFFAWSRVTPAVFVKEFALFASCILPFSRSVWNAVTWSIAEEMRISLVFPFMALAIRRVSWRWTLLATLIASTISFFSIRETHHFFPWLTMHYAGIFAVGAVLAKHRHALGAKLQKLRPFYWLISIAALAIIAYGPSALLPVVPAQIGEQVSDLAVTVGNTLILLLALEWIGFRNLLVQRPILALGRVSYSFYLLHLPMLFLIACLLWDRTSHIIVFALALVCTCLGALILYKWVEQPSIALGRRLTHRKA